MSYYFELPHFYSKWAACESQNIPNTNYTQKINNHSLPLNGQQSYLRYSSETPMVLSKWLWVLQKLQVVSPLHSDHRLFSVSAVGHLDAFYDIHGRKGEMLFYSSVMNSAWEDILIWIKFFRNKICGYIGWYHTSFTSNLGSKYRRGIWRDCTGLSLKKYRCRKIPWSFWAYPQKDAPKEI
jgi:hypothetical protein